MLSTNSAEFGLTITAIPVVLILLIGAGLAVKREVKWYLFSMLDLQPMYLTIEQANVHIAGYHVGRGNILCVFLPCPECSPNLNFPTLQSVRDADRAMQHTGGSNVH